MNTLALLAILPVPGLIGILIWVAIACIVIWAIVALVRWSGIPVPVPVQIILTALVAIFLVLLVARLFDFLV